MGRGAVMISIKDIQIRLPHKDLETKLCHVRVVDNQIQFGIKKHFDRWANSVDYVYYGTPANQKKLDLIITTVDRLIKEKVYNDGWGDEVDISDHMRKTRRS